MDTVNGWVQLPVGVAAVVASSVAMMRWTVSAVERRLNVTIRQIVTELVDPRFDAIDRRFDAIDHRVAESATSIICSKNARCNGS